MTSAKRNIGADLIRILAFFSVVSVHFFLNNGFYSQAVEGKRMFVMTLMRSFFIICVPLFLTLSGYLSRRKKLEKSYYKKIGKLILTYLLASLLCLLYTTVFLKTEMTVKSMIFSILNFTAAPYSWYIEMYLGLFLLIPFLNIVYNALPSQRSKLWLIITFVILSALPSALNIYDLNALNWSSVASSYSVTQLIPDWWQTVYPITYYFIGCYLGEYGLKINKWLNLLLIILWTVFFGAYCYWRSYKATFFWGSWCDYHSLFNVVLTVLVFAFVTNINYDRVPARLSRLIQRISGLCLCAYLVSWIFDNRLYSILLEKVPLVTSRLEYYFVIVPIVFVLSLIASYLLSIIQLLIEKGFSLLCGAVRKKSTKTIQEP